MDVVNEIKSLGLSIDTYEKCLNEIIEKKNFNTDIDWNEICEKYDLPYSSSTLRKANGTIFGGAFVKEYIDYCNKVDQHILNNFNINDTNKDNKDNKDNKANKNDKNDKNDYINEFKINKDGTYSSNRLIEMTEKNSKDPEFILNAHGFDPKSWKIVSARNTIRQAISKDSGVVTLYASFITVKPVSDINIYQIEDFYNELCSKNISPIIKKNENYHKNGYMLEVPIEDVHFGKFSLSEDVSDPYNYNLAKERFSYVIDDIIESVKNFDIEKIIFPIGSDFFHVDNMQCSTTAGTKQNTDLSPQLIFKYGIECLIENILKLSTIAPVEVFCINGNHDFLTSYHAICSLDCYFHNNENVVVNTDTSPRKYIEFGNSLIGFTHGDKEKNRIEGLMQIEAREAWGRTKYHEFHMGHLHSEQTREVNGIIIRNLSSFTGTDNWHMVSGYVGSVKKCQSFLWDKEYGLKNIIISVVQ